MTTFSPDTFDWTSLIRRGVESDELDYKAHQDWSKLPKAGKAKFVRHCLAMANTKGGFVVVGVGEDSSGRPALFTGLTEEESRSFDPTDVGTFINRYADPPVDFTLHRPVVDGKRYAVFAIRRFTTLPHVCASTCSDELQQGVFYIRTADASSRPAFRSSELHGLILRAMRNQREQLSRMLRGLLLGETADAVGDTVAESHFTEEVHHSLNFRKKLVAGQQGPFLDYVVMPSLWMERRFSLTQLRKALEKIACPEGASPLFDAEKIYSTNLSIRFAEQDAPQFFQLFRSGLLHCSLIPETVDYDFLRHFCATVSEWTGLIYRELTGEEEALGIRLVLSGTQGLSLLAENGEKGICRIPEIDIRCTGSPGRTDTEKIGETLFRSLCERFNLPGTGSTGSDQNE